MDASERKNFILDKINQNGIVKISDISNELSVSRETIRKDIYQLGNKHLLKVIRGGAEAITQNIRETSFNTRKRKNVEGKIQIAKTALSEIHSNSSIYLDFGSTTYILARQIVNSSLTNLTIVTNSLNIANVIKANQDIELVILGGIFRPGENSLSGPLAANNIRNIYCDIGFFSCGGLDTDAGITNHFFNEVEVSKRMMSHSQRHVVLADHSKFNRKALYQTSDLSDMDEIITDKIDAGSSTQKYAEKGVNLIASIS